MAFGQILRKVKKVNHLTDDELALICGVSRGSITKYYKNTHSPSLDVVSRLATRFPEFNWSSLLIQDKAAPVFEINDFGKNSSYKNYSSQGKMTVNEADTLEEEVRELRKRVKRYENIIDGQERMIQEKDRQIAELKEKLGE